METKPLTPKELAKAYNICIKTLYNRLRPYKVLLNYKKGKRKRMFTLDELGFIYTIYGNPNPK